MENDRLTTRLKPLRIWIPMLLLPMMVVARYIPSLIEDGPALIWMASAFGPGLIGLIIVGWFATLSRAAWYERIIGVLGVVAIIVLTTIYADKSIQGPLVIVMLVPMCTALFAITLIVLSGLLSIQRTLIALIFAFLGALPSALVKTDGVWGNFTFGLQWRWDNEVENKFLADKAREKDLSANKIAVQRIDVEAFKHPEWPGFRGANHDAVQHGIKFVDDWSTVPPKEMWRIPVGPGWSSFAVAGHYLVTQEQRGEVEAVVCYDADSGKELWVQSVPSRFFEALGGLGPRATPTIADGYVYAMGAEGWLMKLDAKDGEVVWKKDLRVIANRAPPMWGFSSSPLVHEGLVCIHAAGSGDKGVLAFDVDSGELKWSAPAGEHSYGSLQTMNIRGNTYFGILSETGAHFYEPKTGTVVLDYKWDHSGYRALQPVALENDRVLIPTGMGSGTRLIKIEQKEGGLEGETVWTSRKMKPDFNDLVVGDGFAFGFDNAIFCCIDLADGEQKWKGGRYGKGQVILLKDSNLLIVAGEGGEIALVRATSEKFDEIAKFQALKGKTWNHPVVVGDRLYIRNAEEAVCYRMPVVAAE